MFNYIRLAFSNWFKKTEEEPVKIERLNLPFNKGQKWGRRPDSMINKVIVHQSLGNGNTLSVYRYHISETSHLKIGGAPNIAYHFSIEKDGTIYMVNDIEDVVWHCFGQNLVSIGVVVIGDFTGEGHVGSAVPTEEQLKSLGKLLGYIEKKYGIKRDSVFGHRDFGKPACPGTVIYKYIQDRKKNVG